VYAGKESDGNCFKFEGVFTPQMSRVAVPATSIGWVFAVTSLVVHDPWSLPFVSVSSRQSDGCLIQNHYIPELLKRAAAPAATVGNATAHYDEVVLKEAYGQQQAREKDWVAKKIGGASCSWGLLTASQKWMMHFVMGADGGTLLKKIPSMAKRENWCDSVIRMLNPERGCHILVYAHVERCAFCPVIFLASGEMHRHHSNNAMLFCVEDTELGVCRMFMRCFSQKCKAIHSQTWCGGKGSDGRLICKRVKANGWVEIKEEDWVAVGLHSKTGGLATTGKEEGGEECISEGVSSPPIIIHEDISILDIEDIMEEDAAVAIAPALKRTMAEEGGFSIEKWKQIPRCECKWMCRALLLPMPPRNIAAAALLLLPIPVVGGGIQPCEMILKLFKLKYAQPLVYGILPHTLSYCPRYLATKKQSGQSCCGCCHCQSKTASSSASSNHNGNHNKHKKNTGEKEEASPTVILIIEESNPSCQGRSYRLFVLCATATSTTTTTTDASCAYHHKKHSKKGSGAFLLDPWVELNKDMALQIPSAAALQLAQKK